ncbi:MAG TPA: hypothetical protein VF290_20170 [Pyrinomonadaceae bacterium]
MKRYRLLGLLVFIVTMVASVAIYWRLTYYRVWLSSTSPGGKYTVELTGDKGRGGFVVPSVVKYNLLVDGKVLTRNRFAHSGDFMDISFELAYPDHAWMDEKILRFWFTRHNAVSDRLLIANNTGKRIKFLRIRVPDNMYFVFDVEPRTSLTLTLAHTAAGNDFWAEGEFEDGSQIGFGSDESGKPGGLIMTTDRAHPPNR